MIIKVRALVAAQCKSGLLRTPNTIQQFKSVQAPPGGQSPILHFFSTLLEYGGRLSALESVELLLPAVQQQRRELVEKWLKEDKLECTEELGDIVRPLEVKFALSIYLRANSHQKVIQCFVEVGQFDQIVPYVKKVGYQAEVGLMQWAMEHYQAPTSTPTANPMAEPTPAPTAQPEPTAECDSCSWVATEVAKINRQAQTYAGSATPSCRQAILVGNHSGSRSATQPRKARRLSLSDWYDAP